MVQLRLFSRGVQRAATRLTLAVLCLALSACSLTDSHDDELPAVQSVTCDRLYTYAPGFLIMDLAAGSDVSLNPGLREFPVFCSAAEAQRHLVTMVSMDRLPRGDWAVYALNGGGELACARSPDQYVLAKPASLAEWIPDRDIVHATSSSSGTRPAGQSVHEASTARTSNLH